MRRNKRKDSINWTDKMLEDLLKCKRDAMSLKNSQDCPRLPNKRKKGYMEIMLELWNNIGYSHLDLTAQNLRDRASQAERIKDNLVLPLQNVISEHGNIPNIESANQSVRDEVNDHNNIPDIQTLEESVRNDVNDRSNIPNIVEINDPVLNQSINYTLMEDIIIPSNVEEFVNNNACIIEASKNRFNEISIIEGDMSKREYHTKWKNKPANKDIESIDKLSIHLFAESNGFNVNDVTQRLWLLNCATYSAIVTWSLSNDIKLQKVVNQIPTGIRTPNIPRWLQCIENEIAETRKTLSQCVNERDRLQKGGRLTRKLKRNRRLIEEKCKTISVYNLTVLIEKLKSSLRYKAKKRKKKLKAMKTKKVNEIFIKSPSDIYKRFDNIIKKDETIEEPKFSEVERKERKFFHDIEEVENFWRGLWTSADKGKPHEEWLNDIEEIFAAKVPIINEGNINISQTDVHNAIKKKRNWSSAGPDRIVNFWWKHLKLPMEITKCVFNNIINEAHKVPRWYCRGRTPLLEKEGEWSHQNQRPITCLNTHYKWMTSILLKETDTHLNNNNMLQIDQRGARANCCGTTDNLLIDDMILRDASYNKKNMSCAWLDVKKAYDSVSHSWLKRMLTLHRLPKNITSLIENIMENWSLSIVFPIESGMHESEVFKVENGILQGDSLSGSLYCLCKNPISWHLRRYEGYVLSMTLKPKITHSLFIDDAKLYARNLKKLKAVLDDLEEKMSHAGLFWNEKKCKVLNLIRGKPNEGDGNIILKSGKKLECLKDAETYRFLGIPEAEKHDITNLFETVSKKIKQRLHVIWSSPLYDINKVIASNQFAIALVGYYMWSEKFNLNNLRQIDRDIRGILNKNGAKHPTQINELLYIPRAKGGRGLKSIEEIYKDTKIKSATKLALNPDAHMQVVKSFHLLCQQKSFASIFTDAIKYGKELNIEVEILEDEVSLKSPSDTLICSSQKDNIKVKSMLKKQRHEARSKVISDSTWQGLTIQHREADESICKGYFDWAAKWKTCPTYVIREIYDMIYQLLPTKAYLSTRSNLEISNTKCRFCHKKEESVIHLVSSCKHLAKHDYLRRHNKALQCFLSHVLLKYGFIDVIPPWFSKLETKPYYNNEKATIWYDIPEFIDSEIGDGEEEEDENEEDQENDKKKQRPDGKILLKHEKQIFVVEMSVPWISNRDTKYIEKVEKYERIRRNLKINYPDHTIDQITLIIDVYGGYSKELPMNIQKIINDKSESERIIYNMIKVVMSDLSYLSKKFKAMADVL